MCGFSPFSFVRHSNFFDAKKKLSFKQGLANRRERKKFKSFERDDKEDKEEEKNNNFLVNKKWK